MAKKTDSIKARAESLAARTDDAYSSHRYRSWTAVAATLLRLGMTDEEAEEVMRSKYTRWAADAYAGTHEYGRVPAAAVREFVVKNAHHLKGDLGVEWRPS